MFTRGIRTGAIINISIGMGRATSAQIPRILARLYCSSVSIVFCDVDFFKTINDTMGHPEGDKVLISKYGGTEVKHDGDDLLVLSSRDVLAILG